MDAMIFAAGLGTRLRPLTDTLPKALVEIAGVTMLELVARRLVDAGATRLIVNAHHHAAQLAAFIASRDGFGVETVISDESDLLLDTGGGLKRAVPLFRKKSPLVLHNVDIVTDIDLRALYRAHGESNALVTLAVMVRPSSRYLTFDAEGSLCGYGNTATGYEEWARAPVGKVERLGFCGIHVADPAILGMIEEEGKFSIIYPLYMRLIREGARIAAHRVDGALWIDIGSHEQLDRARRMFGGTPQAVDSRPSLD
jgi:NDP-sugar pyrophosphorylase family protein